MGLPMWRAEMCVVESLFIGFWPAHQDRIQGQLGNCLWISVLVPAKAQDVKGDVKKESFCLEH